MNQYINIKEYNKITSNKKHMNLLEFFKKIKINQSLKKISSTKYK